MVWIGVAIAGSMILGVFHMTGRYKAAKYAQKFLGRGYHKTSSGRWVSADGFRQVRWDTTGHLFHGIHTKPHFNLETFRLPIGCGLKPGRPIKNIHVWIGLFRFIL